MKRCLLHSATLMFAMALTQTALGNKDYEAKAFTSEDGKTLNYRIHSPTPLNRSTEYPLVIVLHGAGERGKDNARQLVHGGKDIVAYSKKANKPAFIVFPQCPHKQQWVNTPWGDLEHTMPENPSDSMALVLQLIDKLRKDLPVDEKQILVAGLSMGGFGTWDIIQRKPDLFAAALPICGGGDTAEAAKIKDIPIWVVHGANDRVVKTKRSRDMVKALKDAGGEPIYTEYEGVAHNSWSKTFANDKVWEWFFSQKKSK